LARSDTFDVQPLQETDIVDGLVGLFDGNGPDVVLGEL